MKYRVYSGRNDVTETIYTHFNADSDEEAVEKLKELKAKPHNAWDRLRMVEVIQEEKIRQVETIQP